MLESMKELKRQEIQIQKIQYSCIKSIRWYGINNGEIIKNKFLKMSSWRYAYVLRTKEPTMLQGKIALSYGVNNKKTRGSAEDRSESLRWKCPPGCWTRILKQNTQYLLVKIL